MYRQAKGFVSDEVDRRSTAAGQQISSTADHMKSIADQLRGDDFGRPAARYVDQGAAALEQFGQYLRDSDSDRLMTDAESFGRQRPWAVIVAGLAVGLAASRMLKASGAQHEDTSYGSMTEPRSTGSVGSMRLAGAGPLSTPSTGLTTPSPSTSGPTSPSASPSSPGQTSRSAPALTPPAASRPTPAPTPPAASRPTPTPTPPPQPSASAPRPSTTTGTPSTSSSKPTPPGGSSSPRTSAYATEGDANNSGLNPAASDTPISSDAAPFRARKNSGNTP